MLLELLCFLVVALLLRQLPRRWKYDLHKIPSPRGFPFLGNTLDFMSGRAGDNITRWVGHALKKLNYPKLMKFEVMGVPMLVVTDDHFIKTVMMSPKEPFPKLVVDGGIILPMFGDNLKEKCLLFSAGISPHVKAVRRIYATSFQSNQLKTAMPKVTDVIQKMMDIIESERRNGPVDFQNLSNRLTMDVIGSVAFDANLGGLDRSREFHEVVVEIGHVIRKVMANPLQTLYCYFFPMCDEAQHRRQTYYKVIEEWKNLVEEIENREDPAPGEEPLWYKLKSMVDPKTKMPISSSVLTMEVATVVVGGMDTTGNQLAWILAILADRPDVVDKILEELTERGLHGPLARDVRFEDLCELRYLTAVIMEAMRVAHVSSAGFARTVPRDMTILGYRVPEGTRIMRIGNRAFSVDVDWEDPLSFTPEKWLKNDASCYKENLMFSLGPRDCPGQKLAMLQMRLVIIALAKAYNLELVGSYQDIADSAVTGLVTEAEHGILLNMTPKRSRSPCSC